MDLAGLKGGGMRKKNKWAWGDMKLGRGLVVELFGEERVYQIAHQLQTDTEIALVEVDKPDNSVWWIQKRCLRENGKISKAGISDGLMWFLGTQKLLPGQLEVAQKNVAEHNRLWANSALDKLFVNQTGKKAAQAEWNEYLKGKEEGTNAK